MKSKTQRLSPLLQIRNWLLSGEMPPKTHKKSMLIMVALLCFGIPSFTVFILAALQIRFYDSINSLGGLAFVSFITLMPGIYALWITVCCWRRVKGYSWDMIPYFD